MSASGGRWVSLETLAASFGATASPPRGTVAVRGEWALIGAVIDSPDGVRYVPRHGITPDQRIRLVSAAVQVSMRGRTALPGWQFDPRRGWVSGVKTRQPASGASSSAMSSCISSADNRYPVVSAGLREPSGL